MTSAIFNQGGDAILASTYSYESHIVVLDPSDLSVVQKIKLSFEENCSHNYFKIYSLNGYHKGHLMASGAVFIDQTGIDDNYGHLIQFWIHQELGLGSLPSVVEDLKKANPPRIKYYYDFDEQHLTDEFPPTFKTVFL